MNQGIVSYYRGFNAFFIKTAINQGAKFVVFDELEKRTGGTFTASMITALGVTLISYPFDVAHCRMACDVSKKPTVLQNTKRDKSTGMYVQH